MKVGDEITCVVASNDLGGQTTMLGIVEWTTSSADGGFVRFKDRTHTMIPESRLGVEWLYGHHAPDSTESKALLVACSLGN